MCLPLDVMFIKFFYMHNRYEEFTATKVFAFDWFDADIFPQSSSYIITQLLAKYLQYQGDITLFGGYTDGSK